MFIVSLEGYQNLAALVQTGNDPWSRWSKSIMNLKTGQTEPISFGHAYAQSETFRALFQDGMTLVEETANYLDGDGRAAAKTLTRPSSIV